MLKRYAILVTFVLNKTLIFKDLTIVFSDRSTPSPAFLRASFANFILFPPFFLFPFDHVTIFIPLTHCLLNSNFSIAFLNLSQIDISLSFFIFLFFFFSFEMLKLSCLNSCLNSLKRFLRLERREQRNSPEIFKLGKLVGKRVAPNRKEKLVVYVITGRFLPRFKRGR